MYSYEEITELISQGVFTQDELDSVIQDAIQDFVTDEVARSKVIKLQDKLDNHEIASKASIYYDSQGVSMYPIKGIDAHGIRQSLRNVLGSWEDKISHTYINGDKLQVTYTGYVAIEEEEDDIRITYIIYYDLDNLPTGLLKDSCKIVEKTTKVIECSVS